jgi:hypothetical protein
VLVDDAALVVGLAAGEGAAVTRGAVYVGFGAIGAGAGVDVVGGRTIGRGVTGGAGGAVGEVVEIVAGSPELGGSTELGTYAGVLPGGSVSTTPTMIATITPSALITRPRTDTCRWSQCFTFPRMGAKITVGSWRLPVQKAAKPLCNSGFRGT